MGSIVKKITQGALAAVLALGLTPAGAFASAYNVEGLARVADPITYSSTSGQVNLETNVSIQPVSPLSITSRSSSLNLTEVTSSDAVYVTIANGKGPYDVTWHMAMLDPQSVEGELRDVTVATADGGRIPDSVSEDSGTVTLSHYIINDGLSEDGVYNYYVTVIDRGAGEADKKSVSTLEPERLPIKVVLGKSEFFSGESAVLTSDPWRLAADNGKPEGEGWNGVLGKLNKHATMKATQLATAEAQNASDYYKKLRDEALNKHGSVIAGETAGVQGTAAWRIVVDNNNELSVSQDVFIDDVLLTLTLDQATLASLGFADGRLPSDFAQKYTVMQYGGKHANPEDAGIKCSEPELVLDSSGNPTGQINIVVEGIGVVNSGDWGVFALVRKADDVPQFTVSVAQPGDDAHGRIVWDEVSPLPVGAAPMFTFVPDDGYQLVSVSLTYEGEPLPDKRPGAQGGATMPNPIVDTSFKDSLRNTLTLDSSITGEAWSRNVTVSAAFEKKSGGTAEKHKLHVIANTEFGTIKLTGTGVDDVEITGNGGTIPRSIEVSPDVSYSFEFDPDPGHSPKVEGSMVDPGLGGAWEPINVLGETYNIGKPTRDMWFRLDFKEDSGEDKDLFWVTVDHSGDGGASKAYLADGGSRQQYRMGTDVSVKVDLEQGYRIASAYAVYMSGPGEDAVETGRSSIIGSYDSKKGIIKTGLVTCHTVVRVVFDKEHSGGTDATLTVAGMKRSGSSTLIDESAWSTSLDGNSVTVTVDDLSNPPSQTIYFYYRPEGSSKYWVLDALEITQDGKTTIKGVGAKESNFATLSITGDMSVVAVMKEPSGGGGIVEKPAPSTDVPAPGVSVNDKGEVTVTTQDGTVTLKPSIVGGKPVYAAPSQNYNPRTGTPFVDDAGALVGAGGYVSQESTRGVWVRGGNVMLAEVPGEDTKELRYRVGAGCENDALDEALEHCLWEVEAVYVMGICVAPYTDAGNGKFERDSDGRFWLLEDSIPGVGPAEGADGRTGVWFEVSDVEGGASEELVTFHNVPEGMENPSVAGVFEPYVNISAKYVTDAAGKPVSGAIGGSVTLSKSRLMIGKMGDEAELVEGLLEPEDGKRLSRVSINGAVRYDRSEKIGCDESGVPTAGSNVRAATLSDYTRLTTVPTAVAFSAQSARQSEDQVRVEQPRRSYRQTVDNVRVGSIDREVDILGALGVPDAWADPVTQVPEGAMVYTVTKPLRSTDAVTGTDLGTLLGTGGHTLNMLVEFEDENEGGGSGGVGGGSGSGNGSGGGSTVVPITHKVTISVASGQGWIGQEGQKSLTLDAVQDGKSTGSISLIPAKGYQVVSIVDNGVETPTTRDVFEIVEVTEDHEVKVKFGMVSVPGPNGSGDRVVRRITAMLRTGDGTLPLVFVSLGVAFCAAGVAVFASGKRRKRD